MLVYQREISVRTIVKSARFRMFPRCRTKPMISGGSQLGFVCKSLPFHHYITEYPHYKNKHPHSPPWNFPVSSAHLRNIINISIYLIHSGTSLSPLFWSSLSPYYIIISPIKCPMNQRSSHLHGTNASAIAHGNCLTSGWRWSENSVDWFKGKSAGNNMETWNIKSFPVNFSTNPSEPVGLISNGCSRVGEMKMINHEIWGIAFLQRKPCVFPS